MGRPPGSKNRPKNVNGDTQTAGIGHNTVSGDQLRRIIERIEQLESDKKQVADDIRDVYAEVKSGGYDVKALRAIVRMRRQDESERSQHEATLETYMHALGMLADLPLGQAALRREGLSPDQDESGFSNYPEDSQSGYVGD